MKILFPLFLSMLCLLLSLHASLAADIEGNLQTSPFSMFEIRHLRNYEIWVVIRITEETVTLERTKTTGEKEQVEIARSRLPSLQVGDQVRYDQERDRIRQTVMPAS